jgi:hypothetical protein
MADNSQGFNPIGTVEGIGVGMAANNLLGRFSPIPLPSFYDSRETDPRQGFSNSQAAKIARGEKHAIGQYIGQAGGTVLGDIIGAPLGPFAPLVGKGVGYVGGKLGGWIADRTGHRDPTATVVAGGNTYDANGGLLASGTPGSQNGYGNSAFGPYSSGYQSMWADSPDNGPVMPSFSNYSDQFTGGDGSIDDSNPSGGYNYSGNGYSAGSGYGGLGNMGSLGTQGQLSGSTIGANSVFGGTYWVNPPSGAANNGNRGHDIAVQQQ